MPELGFGLSVGAFSGDYVSECLAKDLVDTSPGLGTISKAMELLGGEELAPGVLAQQGADAAWEWGEAFLD